MPYARVEPTSDGSLAFSSTYDRALVDALKQRIPYADRRWDHDWKRWLVAPAHLQTLEAISQQHLGVQLHQTKPVYQTQPQTEQRLLKVEYIGAPKQRDDGSWSAFGYCDGDWSVIFPQDALKAWFEGGPDTPTSQAPTQAATLYGVLDVRRTASAKEIKSAWRKMAKRWHPDVNQDPDASEMMKKINDAYEVLSDARMRKKYDAGLRLEESVKKKKKYDFKSVWTAVYGSSWRPPIRCGYILVEGVAQLGRFQVEKILHWEDIVDDYGRAMVTSWPAGSEHFVVSWV